MFDPMWSADFDALAEGSMPLSTTSRISRIDGGVGRSWGRRPLRWFRLGSFFEEPNYTNVRGLFLFGY